MDDERKRASRNSPKPKVVHRGDIMGVMWNLINKWKLPREKKPIKDGNISYFAMAAGARKNPLVVIRFSVDGNENIGGCAMYNPKKDVWTSYVYFSEGEPEYFDVTSDRNLAIQSVIERLKKIG